MHADQNPNTTSEDPLQDTWDQCSSGELQRMVGRLNLLEYCAKRNRVCFCGAVAMLLIAGTVVMGGMLLTQGMPNYGGLTCAECQSHFIAYHDHLTGQTVMKDAELAGSMKIHLAKCKPCHSKFNTKYPGLLAHAPSHSLLKAIPALVVAPFSVFSTPAGI